MRSGKVIYRFDRLEQHTARNKKPYKQCVLAAHAFNYIVLRINPGLTNCEDLAMVVNSSLDNN